MDQDLVYKEQPPEFGDGDLKPQKLGGLEISPRVQHAACNPAQAFAPSTYICCFMGESYGS